MCYIFIYYEDKVVPGDKHVSAKSYKGREIKTRHIVTPTLGRSEIVLRMSASSLVCGRTYFDYL
jgi:hypothetical protein